MAAKSLPGSHKESKPELESNDDEDMIDQFVEDSKKQKLNEEQRRAFYSVLLAFRAETLSSGNVNTSLLSSLNLLCLLLFKGLSWWCFRRELRS